MTPERAATILFGIAAICCAVLIATTTAKLWGNRFAWDREAKRRAILTLVGLLILLLASALVILDAVRGTR